MKGAVQKKSWENVGTNVGGVASFCGVDRVRILGLC